MQKNKYTFKKATIKDLNTFWPAFAKNIKTQFPEYSIKTRKAFLEKEYPLQYIEEGLKDKRIALYLAYSKNEVAGFLYTTYICGGIGMANWLAVAKEHQGHGIATALLKMWQKDAKRLGMHKIHLWTDKRNLDFYKKQGFTYVGKIPKSYYGADDYLFYKILQPPKENNFLKRIKL
ncbi:MAG: GNAT family N-acetyltransferase [bacterium]|nr:GNAT family N-acetyltransferase [bacterium]